ncbi:DNA sulfur modification protein DndB [Bacillus sp. AL-1R]
MKINAIKYEWQEYICYIGIIKYKDVPNLINVNSDLSMNREINSPNVKTIKKYISNELESTFFPPVILSCTIQSEYDDNFLKIIDGQLTIIDGQHRIKAISELLKDSASELRTKLNNMVLPVLIIEGLESFRHRELFNMINDKARTVDSNISVRFSSSLENIIGLKYIREKGLKDKIEWESKQSKDKIVYLHLVECIKELILSLKKLSDDLNSNDTALYEIAVYYKVFENFLNRVFDFIDREREIDSPELKIIKKKVFLRAISGEISERIKEYMKQEGEKKLEEVNILVGNTMDKLLNDFILPYSGVTTVKEPTYFSLRNFLRFNYILVENKENIETVLPLISKYIESYKKQEILEINEDEFEIISNFIKKAIENRDRLSKLNLREININKQTTLEEYLMEESEENELATR